jgi:hypothetical protein
VHAQASDRDEQVTGLDVVARDRDSGDRDLVQIATRSPDQGKCVSEGSEAVVRGMRGTHPGG